MRKNENFQFCTKMYMGSARNAIEFGFNSQAVLILLLLLKQFMGLNCCHLTKIVVNLNPSNSLVDRHAHRPIVMHLDISQMLCSSFRVRIRVET